MDHKTYFAWKTTVYNVKLTCLLTDSFIFIVKKVERSAALYSGLLHNMEELAKSQFRTINVQETVFQEDGLTMANINLPQGE